MQAHRAGIIARGVDVENSAGIAIIPVQPFGRGRVAGHSTGSRWLTWLCDVAY